LKPIYSLFFITLIASSSANADVLSALGEKVINMAGGSIQPTIVLAPNIKMDIGGNQIVKISGDDQCPNDWNDNLTGQPVQRGCVVLDKPVVTVHYRLAAKHVTERWQVKSEGGRTSLIRPNGSLVAQAK